MTVYLDFGAAMVKCGDLFRDYSATSTDLLFSCNEASMQKFVYIVGL